MLAVVLIVLAAAGAFSGKSHPPAASRSKRPAGTTTTRTTGKAQPPTTTLKPGQQGAQVRRLQRALTRLGYSPGKIDGQYGAATKQALANFQGANNLNADGILGPKTLAALSRSLNNHG